MAEGKWGEGVVTWKALIPLLITMVVSGASLFGYVLSMHAAQPHDDAVEQKQLDDLKDRMTRQEQRQTDALRRIENKLDKMAGS